MQKILYRKGSNLTYRDSAIQEVAEARQGLDRDLKALEGLHDSADRRRIGTRNRDQNGGGPLPRHDAREIITRAQNLDAVDALAHLGGIIINETNRLVLINGLFRMSRTIISPASPAP